MSRKILNKNTALGWEIIVDAYGSEEQAMGRYYFLQDNISFPFRAIYIVETGKSPLRPGDKVKILDMAPEDDCQHEMLVERTWKGRKLAVPLAQLQPLESSDEKMKEAVADWHYWTARGYELS